MDQLAVCVRYVLKGKVIVRLLSFTVAQNITGESLYLLTKSLLEKFQINMNQNVGCSFDGASNMKGEYQGLQAHLKENNNLLMYVHCFSHQLNLVLTKSIDSTKAVKDFFGLLQTTAVFISESHKRMTIWTEVNRDCTEGHQLLRRLQKVNCTRWWSKNRALESIFDDSSVPFE